jgi:hypothetical protein
MNRRFMIRHTVAFKLRHASGSDQEREFLRAACALAAIPTVRRFECMRQVSSKSGFDFGLSMEFEGAQDYRYYNEHPDHVRFVESRWIPEVEAFAELDYAPMD